MRLKCLGILNYYERASKVAEEKHLESLLGPDPRLHYSADEAFGCDGSETFEKAWPLEVLTKYMHAPETSNIPLREVDISCPIWIREWFIFQLLPQAVLYSFSDCITVLPGPVAACAWFKAKETRGLPKVREIEPYIQDLPDSWEFPDLNKEILKTYFHLVEQIIAPSKEDSSTEVKVPLGIEPGPETCFFPRNKEDTIRSALQMLDDAGSDISRPGTVHKIAVKTFEIIGPNNEIKEHVDDVPHHRNLEEYATTVVQNNTAHVYEDLRELTCLLEFEPAAFVLDRSAPKLEVDRQHLHYEESRFFSECTSLLEDVPLKSDVKKIKQPLVRVMFEVPEVIEEAKSGNFLSLELGAYTADLINPSSVVLADLSLFRVASQSFENLIVMPELTLDHSRFRSLPVPLFNQEQEARIAEDVFKNLFRTKTLSPTSASDWLYLDWHMSQVGHCNNHTCFRIQQRVKEDQLREPIPLDMVSEKKTSNVQLLLILAEYSSAWHLEPPDVATNSEHYVEEVYPAVEAQTISMSPSMLDSGSFPCIAEDHSILIEEKKDSSTGPRLPSATSDPASMASVLTLMKQARRGAILRDTSLEQLQGHGNLQNEPGPRQSVEGQSRAASEAGHQVTGAISVFETCTTFPLCSPFGVATTDITLQTLRSIQPGHAVSLEIPACPAIVPTQTAFTSAPPLQPASGDLSPGQSGLEETQMSFGQGPHVIVIANTLQPGPVLLQRRSSYQKILGLDNEDLQVVEREHELPVDLILSPSTCLIIYTGEKMKLHWSDVRNSSSEGHVTRIIETIVDCHLRAMSFSFQMCIMIFEGEAAITSAILHIMGEVYIAAARFDMRVQCFISGDPKCTDDLVLKCIKRIWRMAKRPYDYPMSENLTDGEVFLAHFPSLNPLSSHAILCLSVPLSTFMSWSHEEQVSALQGFDVPAESLKLFHSQSEYGKLERAAGEGAFSDNPWPYASEIVPLEVDCHDTDNFPYFPPASEISGELEREGPAGEEHSDMCSRPPPDTSQVDPFFVDLPTVQGCISWDDPYWQPEPCLEPCETSHLQRPNSLRERSHSQKPGCVQSYLDEWLERRKREKHNILETELELGCGSSRDSTTSFFLQTHLDTIPAWAPGPTVDPIHGRETNSWGESPGDKMPGKRTSPAWEVHRHQRELSPAMRPPHKKLKPPVSTRRFNLYSDCPAVTVSRHACYRFSAPITRSV